MATVSVELEPFTGGAVDGYRSCLPVREDVVSHEWRLVPISVPHLAA
jgi:hypothetical protein